MTASARAASSIWGCELQRGASRHRTHQHLGRVEREQLPVIHDPDPVGKRSRFIHVVAS